MARNFITYGPIPKRFEIKLATPTGMMKSWNALGLYDQIIRMGKDEVYQVTQKITPEERRRIIELNDLYNRLLREKVASTRRNQGVLTNNGTRLSLQRLDRALQVAQFLLLVYLAAVFLPVIIQHTALFLEHLKKAESAAGVAIILTASLKILSDVLLQNKFKQQLTQLESRIDSLTHKNYQNVLYIMSSIDKQKVVVTEVQRRQLDKILAKLGETGLLATRPMHMYDLL